MRTGIEYRTTERHNNKPVYKKAVNTGAFPDNSSEITEVQVSDSAVDRYKTLDCYGVSDNCTRIKQRLEIIWFGESGYHWYVYVERESEHHHNDSGGIQHEQFLGCYRLHQNYGLGGHMKIIKYQLETEINYGTPEEPDIETLLSPCY